MRYAAPGALQRAPPLARKPRAASKVVSGSIPGTWVCGGRMHAARCNARPLLRASRAQRDMATTLAVFRRLDLLILNSLYGQHIQLQIPNSLHVPDIERPLINLPDLHQAGAIELRQDHFTIRLPEATLVLHRQIGETTLHEPPAVAGVHLGAPAGTSAGLRKVTSMRIQRGIASRIAKPKSKAEMELNKANMRENDAQNGNGVLDRVLKLQNADDSKRFPLVKRSTLHRLMANGGKGRKTNDALSVLTVQAEEMLALYIRLKGLGDQTVTRKEIKDLFNFCFSSPLIATLDSLAILPPNRTLLWKMRQEIGMCALRWHAKVIIARARLERTGTGNGGGTRTDSDNDGNPDEWAEGAYHLRRETRFGIGA
ncbi:hypothetical protein T492DRAFT_875300 [Pavlovales sp. CCMP2436]|nr:hypothetical protein T492DRAFT_875300 [Pavlovales sp. CCMP2436]